MRLPATILLAASCCCSGSTLLLNPSFEDGDMGAWVRTAITGIRPWGRGSASPQDGSWYVLTVDEASITQTFAPVPGGGVSEFSFWVDRPATANLFVELFYATGPSSGSINIDTATGSGWRRYDVRPLLDTGRELSGISVTKLGTGTARLDNFQLTAVPESGVAVFLLLGWAGACGHRSRHRCAVGCSDSTTAPQRRRRP